MIQGWGQWDTKHMNIVYGVIFVNDRHRFNHWKNKSEFSGGGLDILRTHPNIKFYIEFIY